MTDPLGRREELIPGSKQLSIVCFVHKCNRSALEIAFYDVESPNCKQCHLEEFKTLPYPFKHASLIMYDLILIPSRGTFLSDFNSSIGLHIGITSGTGQIIEYDHQGLNCGRPCDKKWSCCLQLNFIRTILGEYIEDESLVRLAWGQSFRTLADSREMKFSKEFYDCNKNNCFDFVLEFVKTWLRLLGPKYYSDTELPERLQDKIEFCKYFVVSETRKMARYISLYRKLKTTYKSVMISTF